MPDWESEPRRAAAPVATGLDAGALGFDSSALRSLRARLTEASTLLQRAGRLAEQLDVGWSQWPLAWELRSVLGAIDEQIASAGQLVAGQIARESSGAGRAGGAGA